MLASTIGRRISGGLRGRCHRAAFISISAKSEPVTKARIELMSGSEGWGMARKPTSTSSAMKPEATASFTGHRRASAWLAEENGSATLASRSAILDDMPRSMDNGNRTLEAKTARVSGYKMAELMRPEFEGSE